MVPFSSLILFTRGGWVVKKWQNSVYVVIEWPLIFLSYNMCYRIKVTTLDRHLHLNSLWTNVGHTGHCPGRGWFFKDSSSNELCSYFLFFAGNRFNDVTFSFGSTSISFKLSFWHMNFSVKGSKITPTINPYSGSVSDGFSGAWAPLDLGSFTNCVYSNGGGSKIYRRGLWTTSCIIQCNFSHN